ncbi:V-type ATPase subunit G [archaeon]|nr:MAG: V-type ATPase subunit G [archaeon]
MNQLKEAERKATQLVQDARKMRGDRLKEAKIEAERIVAAYKAEMEATYQDALAKINSKSGAANNELQGSTNNDINTMSREFQQKKDSVEKMLIDMVINVEVKAPPRRA